MVGEIKWFLIIAFVCIIGLIVGGSFITDKTGQILAGVLTALITTLVSVYATYHSANASQLKASKDELTRYGLLAWRNLDSLQLKVLQELESNSEKNEQALRWWLLDIDQAKLAWQDILKEVFALQERLQAETNELAQEYKEKIGAAKKPGDRLKLEAEKQAHFARLMTSSPLPLRIPGEVLCPNCNNSVAIMIGQNCGDTSTLRCPTCRRMFHAHRAADGSLFTRKQGSVKHDSSSQGLEMENRLTALEAVRDTFAEAPNEIIQGGWKEFFPLVTKKLMAASLGPSDAREIQKWLFQMHAFKLLGPGLGIGIPSPAANYIEYVEQLYIDSLAKSEEPLLAEQVCQDLYGGRTERLEEIKRLIGATPSQ